VAMQLLPSLSRDPETARREKPAGGHLPYARHVDAATIELRDGLLMQTIHLGGLLFETADGDELNYRTELRDAMLRAVGSSRFAIYHHIVRRRADVMLGGEFPDAFSASLDQRWRERLAGRQMFVNELFLTILRRPLQGRLGWADRLQGMFSRSSGGETSLAAEKRALDAAREALMAALAQY
jgi:type IV secretion system protein VirB4